MKKQYSTKKALAASTLSLVLCCAMLIGTTFAWFTDAVASGNNIIKSGNLDVAMYWAEGTDDPATAIWQDASRGAIFNNENWEPGYTEARHVKIANEGALALQYKVSIVASSKVTLSDTVIFIFFIPKTSEKQLDTSHRKTLK